jgi:group I intron endonuclease
MWNTKNGKGYIGQTQIVIGWDHRNHGTDVRVKEHFREAENFLPTCAHLNNAIRKWGKDSFRYIALISCKIQDLTKWEEYFMDLYNTRSVNGRGYNLREAGRCGRASEETRKKMSEAKKGEKHHQWGKPQTDEVKEKIRQTNINNAVREDHDGTTLPKYLKYVNWASEEGYHVVSHPLCKLRKFVSIKKPVDLGSHKARAVAFLNSLN